jgi:hypothetical protein
MNDMTEISLPGPGHNNPPAPPKSPRGEIHFSNPCNAMVSAMAKASLEFENPPKNKTVTVHSRRTGGSYTYAYATLDVLLNCVRRPLARQDLIYISLLYDNRLTATIMHGSGQWMACSMTLTPPEPGKEGVAGENTYWRRQLLQSLTSLAGEDDDDGVAAAGNEQTYVAHPQQRGDWRAELNGKATPDVIHLPDAHDLATLARNASAIDPGLTLLAEWVAQHARVAQLRTHDEAAWNTLVDTVGAGLDRSLGGTVAKAWKWFARASTREHEKAARAMWDGEWDEVLQQFRRACPAGYADLVRHMNACGEAIARTAASAPAAAVDDQEIPAPAVEKAFAEYLVDADGEVQTDEIDDPAYWAICYANVWHNTELELRNSLTDANTGALAKADRDAKAHAILADLYEDRSAAPLLTAAKLTIEAAVVTMPLTRTGTSHLAGYTVAVKAALETMVASEADLIVWEAANHKTIEGLPPGGKARVAQLVSERRRALGITLAEGV